MSSNHRVIPHTNRPQDDRKRPQGNPIADPGVSRSGNFLPRTRTFSPQGHPVIDQTIIANHSGFTDHHTHPVVNHDPPPEGRARVDFDSCPEPGLTGDNEGEKSQPPPPQAVRNTMP
jgi:hypothetical protein